MQIVTQVQNAGQLANKVEREVQLAEVLATLQTLDGLDHVHGEVEVLQTLQPLEVLDPGDGVVLEVDDLQLSAELVQVLQLGDVQLVQRHLAKIFAGTRKIFEQIFHAHLLQVKQAAVVVLCPLLQLQLSDRNHDGFTIVNKQNNISSIS